MTDESLLVAVQEATDISFHIAVDEKWGLPASYAESFELLAQHGVIKEDLARELTKASALRNRLAHGYASVDSDRLWAELPVGLGALDSYSAAVADWLERRR